MGGGGFLELNLKWICCWMRRLLRVRSDTPGRAAGRGVAWTGKRPQAATVVVGMWGIEAVDGEGRGG